MKKLKLYLAHNLDTRKQIREIELELERKYNIELVNPFYDTVRDDIKKIDEGVNTRWEISMKACKNLVKRDLSNITRSDGLLAIIIKPSIGTTLEIGYAKATGKKIFIISEIYIKHPWIKVYATKRFKNFIAFENWLIKEGYKK